MRILVTGGAGYIGSHAVKELLSEGHSVVVFDNLSSGHREAVDPRAQFIRGSTSNMNLLIQRLKAHQIEAVMDFAAFGEISESSTQPFKYYYNNFSNSLKLMHAMMKLGIKKYVFSSCASVYGNPPAGTISEDHSLNPLHPHGKSKMMMEMAIDDFCRAHGLGCTILRYFHVAGASADGTMGEDHRPENHLIPRILKAAARSKEIKLTDDHILRDFVHVVDVARAHVLAIDFIKEGEKKVYNVSSGKSFSMKEILEACEMVTGSKLPLTQESLGPTQPLIFGLDAKRIKQELQWEPLYPELLTMVQHAWKWHGTHTNGYSSRKITPNPPTEQNPNSTVNLH